MRFGLFKVLCRRCLFVGFPLAGFVAAGLPFAGFVATGACLVCSGLLAVGALLLDSRSWVSWPQVSRLPASWPQAFFGLVDVFFNMRAPSYNNTRLSHTPSAAIALWWV